MGITISGQNIEIVLPMDRGMDGICRALALNITEDNKFASVQVHCAKSYLCAGDECRTEDIDHSKPFYRLVFGHKETLDYLISALENLKTEWEKEQHG